MDLPVTTALVLCGGKGTRLVDTETEKPLVEICGTPMVDRVCNALRASSIETVVCVTSPHTPETTTYLESQPDLTVIETSGEGYVADLSAALEGLSMPVLTVAADLPLLTGSLIDDLCQSLIVPVRSTTVCVPVARKRALGLSADTSFTPAGVDDSVTPSGVNTVASGGEETIVRTDLELAVNVNRPADRAVAERYCSHNG